MFTHKLCVVENSIHIEEVKFKEVCTWACTQWVVDSYIKSLLVANSGVVPQFRILNLCDFMCVHVHLMLCFQGACHWFYLLRSVYSSWEVLLTQLNSIFSGSGDNLERRGNLKDREGLIKRRFKIHRGKCGIQLFWSSTYLSFCCFYLTNPIFNLSLVPPQGLHFKYNIKPSWFFHLLSVMST